MYLTVKKMNFEEFDKQEWNELVFANEQLSYFQSYEWCSLWLKHFKSYFQEVIILGVYKDATLIGIGPFVRCHDKIHFLGVSTILDKYSFTDFGDIIAQLGSEEWVWQKLIETLRELFPSPRFSIELFYIKSDSTTSAILHRQSDVELTPIEVAPKIPLPNSWETYLEMLSSHKKSDLKRIIRKAQLQGLKLIKMPENGYHISEFMALASLARPEKVAFFSSIAGVFFQDMLDELTKTKNIEIYFLSHGNNYIAALVLIHFKNTWMAYNGAFDPTYRNLSPGTVLYGLMIEKAILEKKQYFDFLRGDESYKYDLGAINQTLLKATFHS